MEASASPRCGCVTDPLHSLCTLLACSSAVATRQQGIAPVCLALSTTEGVQATMVCYVSTMYVSFSLSFSWAVVKTNAIESGQW